MERIPVFAPHIDVSTIKHLVDALDVGWLGMGATTKEFEEKISSYLSLQNRYIAVTNTGTSALHIALIAAGVKPGDEVITPSFNYVADHQAILMTGANVVMCDIREDNLGIDCEKAELLISKKTKAIIPLHFAGIPCNLNEVYQLAKKYNLRVVEDGCHAFGSTINNCKIGSFGDIACFSFDPVKIITSVDGGCVVVNSEEELEHLHRLRLLGVNKDTTERYKNKRAWDYDVVDQGFRYHMTNILASIGLSQLKQINEFIVSRQKICQEYNKAFSKIAGIQVPNSDFSNVSPFIYYLRVFNNKREKLIAHLQNLEIETGIHFVPVHKHSYFRKSRCDEMTVTNKVVDEIITLPLHSNMKLEFVERIIKSINMFFNI